MDSSQSWDAGLYDQRHAFVWQHGASLIELLAPRPGERILDLGCGTGHLTAQIAAAVVVVVVGLDHSDEMLSQARLAYPDIEFLKGDARAFHFPETFDAVFSNAVLHWIQEPDAVIRCIRQALKPGGRFVAEFGGKGNVQTIVRAMQQAASSIGFKLIEPLWYFPSVGEYTGLLEANGLEVTFAALFDRPTRLEGADGLRDWIRMFARSVLERIPVESQETFFKTIEDITRPTLYHDGAWFADYRRLRVVATAI